METASEIRKLYDPQTGERYLNQDDVVEYLLHQERKVFGMGRSAWESPAQRLRELANTLAHA